jgi:hypothetical protein
MKLPSAKAQEIIEGRGVRAGFYGPYISSAIYET